MKNAMHFIGRHMLAIQSDNSIVEQQTCKLNDYLNGHVDVEKIRSPIMIRSVELEGHGSSSLTPSTSPAGPGRSVGRALDSVW